MSSTLDAKTRSRCDKLRALAERGCGGEREVADKVLAALLKQHGWTREDFDALDIEPRTKCDFAFKTQRDREIIAGVICAVLESDADLFLRGEQREGGKKRYTHVRANCTPREEAQIRCLIPIYQRAFVAAEKDFLIAFILKNKLHAPNDLAPKAGEERPRKALTERERAQRSRIAALALGIDSTPRHQAITATSGAR